MPAQDTIWTARRRPALLTMLALSLAIGNFLWWASPGLNAYFTRDDAINAVHLHGYFTASIPQIAASAAIVATPEYRPLGGLFYRLGLAVFGLNPLALRIAAFVLLGLNILLAYLLVRRISRNWETACLTALFLSYHGALSDLYYDTASIYDILCFGFYASGLLLYVRGRQSGTGHITAGRWLSIAACYGAALDSKEMAVTFPAALILYELCLVPASTRGWRHRLAGIAKNAWPLAALCLFTLVYAAVKLTAGDALSSNPLYRPEISAAQYFRSLAHYFSLLLYAPGVLNGLTAAMVLGALAFLGWLVHSRIILFGTAFTAVSIVPLAFLPPRGGFAFYLPMLGLAIAISALLVQLREKLLTAGNWRSGFASNSSAAVLLALALLAPAHLHSVASTYEAARREEAFQPTRTILYTLRAKFPRLPSHTAILFLDDPFTEDDWKLQFLTQILYDDPSIVVDRVKSGAFDASRSYAAAFRFHDGQLETVDDSEWRPLLAARDEQQVDEQQVLFKPRSVRPGELVTVHIPGFGSGPIDATYRQETAAGGRSGVAYQWVELNGAGAAELPIPEDFPPGEITILRIRRHGEPGWTPATGKLVVAP